MERIGDDSCFASSTETTRAMTKSTANMAMIQIICRNMCPVTIEFSTTETTTRPLFSDSEKLTYSWLPVISLTITSRSVPAQEK